MCHVNLSYLHLYNFSEFKNSQAKKITNKFNCYNCFKL